MPIALAVLALVGIGLYFARREGAGVAPPAGGPTPAPGAGTPPSPTPPSGPAPSQYVEMTPRAGNPTTANRIRSLATLLEKVWTDVTGKSGPVPPGAMELMLSQAAAEGTGYGQGWEMTGNVGSYQCSKGTTGTSYYDCIPHTDSRPNPDGTQTTYTTNFRKYKDGTTPDGKARTALEAGAWDFLESIAVKPFPALDPIVAGDVLGYARKQYGQHYFEGFNLSPDGLAAYKDAVAAVVATNPPVRRKGETAEQVAGRIVFYAAAMARSLPEIAAALGHAKVEAKVFKGLEQKWQPKFQASAKAAVAGAPDLMMRRAPGEPAPGRLAGKLEISRDGGATWHPAVAGVAAEAAPMLSPAAALDQLGATEADAVVNWSGGPHRFAAIVR